MPLTTPKPFFHPAQDPDHFCPGVTDHFRLRPWIGLLLLLLLLGAGEALAETYAVQAGIFKHLKNAKFQYASIYNALPEASRDNLRIEKTGALFAVRIGRFETRAQAEALLPLIKPVSPEAFVWKGDPLPEDVLVTNRNPQAARISPAPVTKPPDPASLKTEEKSSWKIVKPIPPQVESPLPARASPEQPPRVKGPDRAPKVPAESKESGSKRKPEEGAAPEARKRAASETGKTLTKGGEPAAQGPSLPGGSISRMNPEGPPQADNTIPANRAWLQGSIREFSSLSSGQLGLKPVKEIFRLILQVEDTKEVAGYANLLTEKEGDLLTVFSENNLPFFKIGQRINALIEYRGNRYSRFFWIVKAEVLTR
ncbi:MAG: SPOR domain-containing protein [Desulfobacterota bacterium]|jgi:hypothetical protein|nr:SPOR domain-containing protein [Thermodesulfobacteriota bacterium]